MKTKSIVSILSFLAVIFLWSCEKDLLTTNDTEVEVRMGNGNGNNGNGNGNGGGNGNGNGNGNGGDGDGDGDSEPLWDVIYDGTIINSTTAYGLVDVNNPKYELMQTTACGKFTFSGITTLDDIANDCAENFPSDYCVEGTGIRQFDLKKNPGRVANHLWILHPNGNLNLKMFGELVGGPSIFPASGSSVTVNFETWELNSPNCDEVTGDFVPGQASVTITGLGSIDCASTPDGGADTCL